MKTLQKFPALFPAFLIVPFFFAGAAYAQPSAILTAAQAKQAALSEVKNYSSNFKMNGAEGEPYCVKNKCAQKIEAQAPFQSNGKQGFMYVICTSNGEDCHACSPYLSAIEFVKTENGFRPGIKNVNLGRSGAWGKASDKIQIIALSEENSGIVIEDLGMGQGVENGLMRIFTNTGGKLQEALSANILYSDAGAAREPVTDWTAKLNVKKSDKAFNDLIFNLSGEIEGKPMKRQVIYQFKNGSYQSTNAPDFMKN